MRVVVGWGGNRCRRVLNRKLRPPNGNGWKNLCDPTYKVYEAYDLLEGKASQILFDASEELLRCDHEAGLKLSLERHGTPRAAVDSPWQLPGEFVIDRDGIIRLAYRYQYCEDWPTPLVLIAAIKEAAA